MRRSAPTRADLDGAAAGFQLDFAGDVGDAQASAARFCGQVAVDQLRLDSSTAADERYRASHLADGAAPARDLAVHAAVHAASPRCAPLRESTRTLVAMGTRTW